jgi:hypothetical protein
MTSSGETLADNSKRGSPGLYIPPWRKNRSPTSSAGDDSVPTHTKTSATAGEVKDAGSSGSSGRYRGRGFTDEHGYGTKLSASAMTNDESWDDKGPVTGSASASASSTLNATTPEVYEDTPRCTLYLSDISTDSSEIQKSNMLTPYLNKGALSKWISPSEVILVFPTAGITRTASSIPRSYSYKLCYLDDIPDKSAYPSFLKGEHLDL